LLITGSCIGIGMLALPVVTGLSGFFLSSLLLIGACLYMLATAYLLLELDLGENVNANIITMAKHTLGTWAEIATWIAYLFLFYCLMVAYISKGGDVFVLIFQHLEFTKSFPQQIGSLALITMAFPVILGGSQIVDLFNRICVIGLFLSFCILVTLGLKGFESSRLSYSDISYLPAAIPFVITAFGFHNLIPTISDYLDRDRRKLIYSIILGSLIAFTTYLIWNITLQGAVSVNGINGIKESFNNGWIGTEVLYFASHDPLIKLSALYLSFFAIITSLLGQGLGLVDFLFDGIKLKRNNMNRVFILLCIFVPAFLAANTIPNVFFLALGLAGGFAAVFLFCLLPTLMVWSKYRSQSHNRTLSLRLKCALTIILFISLLIIACEIYQLIR